MSLILYCLWDIQVQRRITTRPWNLDEGSLKDIKMVPLERLHTSSYSSSVETMVLSCIVCEILVRNSTQSPLGKTVANILSPFFSQHSLSAKTLYARFPQIIRWLCPQNCVRHFSLRSSLIFTADSPVICDWRLRLSSVLICRVSSVHIIRFVT